MKQFGIIIVTYNSERHVGPLLASLAATVDAERADVWIYDNASPDGTVAALEKELAGCSLPMRLIRGERNLGFMGANNAVYARMKSEAPCENIVLLNPDTVAHAGWSDRLVAALEEAGVGTVASLLLLPNGTINSRGNALHFLGLGFVQGYGEPVAAVPERPALFSGSGAALAFRADVLEAMNATLGLTGIFWEELFLYADDTDLGWRMRMVGLENRLVAASRVTHDHRFWIDAATASGERLYYIERNRYLLMLANFKRATLVVLLPWIVASEIALGLRFWKLYPHRVKLLRAVWAESSTPTFRARRRKIQAGRTVGDHEILRAMTGSIRHGAMPFRPGDRVIDAALRFSHGFICAIVRW